MIIYTKTEFETSNGEIHKMPFELDECRCPMD